MAGNLKVALAQIDIRWEDKLANQTISRRAVAEAAKQKADIIIFPEMTLTGFSFDANKIGERENSSSTLSFFQKLARYHRIAIIFGMVLIGAGKHKAANMALTVDARGRVKNRYQKIHPFTYAKENRFYEGGKRISIFKIKGFKAAVVICYDLRFPGLFEALVRKGVEVIFVIANWPELRIDQWLCLLRARSLDTQCYLVGVNRRGFGNGLAYTGQSAVYSPQGEEILFLKSQDNGGCIELDRYSLLKWRRSFSSLQDKRPDLYFHL